MSAALLLALMLAVDASAGGSDAASSPTHLDSADDATGTSSPPPDLSGPKVDPDAMKPAPAGGMTSDGLAKLGAEPDVTLIGRLDLSDAQREQYEQLLAERWGQFDAIVRDNADLLQQMQVEIARQRTGDNPRPTNRKALQLIRAVRKAFQPYFDRGSFFDEFRPHLTDDQAKDIERTLAEVREARGDGITLNDRRTSRPQRGKRDAAEDAGNVTESDERNTPQRAARRRAPGGQGLARLLRESLERQAAFARESFEQFADDLDLTGTQRQQALEILRPIMMVRQSGEEVNPTVRARAFIEFVRILTPQQRQALRRMGQVEIMRAVPDADLPDRAGKH